MSLYLDNPITIIVKDVLPCFKIALDTHTLNITMLKQQKMKIFALHLLETKLLLFFFHLNGNMYEFVGVLVDEPRKKHCDTS